MTEQTVSQNPRHEHGTGTLAGYSVVSTDWNAGDPLRYEVARIDDPRAYSKALEIVREVREVSGPTQYGVIDNLYTCGCRSERIDGTIARPATLPADPHAAYRAQVRETLRSLSDEALAFQDSCIVGGIDRDECDRELARRNTRCR